MNGTVSQRLRKGAKPVTTVTFPSGPNILGWTWGYLITIEFFDIPNKTSTFEVCSHDAHCSDIPGKNVFLGFLEVDEVKY